MQQLIDLSRYKVIYGDKVLNAVALDWVDFGEAINLGECEKTAIKPKFLGILAINEDGNIVRIYDEAWCFQFIPVINGERSRQ